MFKYLVLYDFEIKVFLFYFFREALNSSEYSLKYQLWCEAVMNYRWL